ncbi:MAG TPA: hypothetical protein VMW65_11755 [Chloroflexota bacterium]|nr:hypothetical protein [Chloroflexota bacterium]
MSAASCLPLEATLCIAAIASDREHGASWLAQEALRATILCAEHSAAQSGTEFLAEAKTCARALIAARPGMAPVRYWVERWLTGLEKQAGSAGDVSQLRKRAARLANDLIAAAREARTLAIQCALGRLTGPDAIFTASYSESVVEACRLAWGSGMLKRVLAAESKSADGHRYGEQVERALADSGIPVLIVPDACIASRVTEAQRIWLGADSVFPDGSVLNGIPSRRLAVAAQQQGRPVDVIAEEAKLDRWGRPNEVEPPPGFELIPVEAISAILTEHGQWQPGPAR